MSPLAQLGYDTLRRELRAGRGPDRAWEAVARAIYAAIIHEQVAERARNTPLPDAVRCRCGARHMRGESHICNDDPKLVARLAGRAS